MTPAKRLRFYLWDRTGMHPSDSPQAERYARKEDYDALEARYLAQGAELTVWQLRVVRLEAAINWHNDSCRSICGIGDQEAVACKYRRYFENNGRRCPTCPVHDILEVPT